MADLLFIFNDVDIANYADSLKIGSKKWFENNVKK